MNGLIKGGIYTFPPFHLCCVLVKELDDNDVLLFNVGGDGTQKSEIIKTIEFTIKNFNGKTVGVNFFPLGIKALKEQTTGFLGVLPDELLKRIEVINHD